MIELIVRALAADGVRMHGFGVKSRGLARYAPLLVSADSLAWSYDGRRSRRPCPRGLSACQNCLHHALDWRAATMRQVSEYEQLTLL